jgi:PAS domain S-box-containing protein
VDITDRRLGEEALLKSEQRFRTFFEGAAEGIIVADAGTNKFPYANPSVCSLFGYSNVEMTHLQVSDLHPADSLAAALETFEKMKTSSTEAIDNLPCRRKDGTVFYADVRSSMLEIDGQNCLVGFFTDVSARRTAEEDSIRHIDELRLKHVRECGLYLLRAPRLDTAVRVYPDLRFS